MTDAPTPTPSYSWADDLAAVLSNSDISFSDLKAELSRILKNIKGA